MSYKIVCVGLDGVFGDTDALGVRLSWVAEGYGQLAIIFYPETQKIVIRNECMSKEFIKAVLCQLVDDAELTDDE